MRDVKLMQKFNFNNLPVPFTFLLKILTTIIQAYDYERLCLIVYRPKVWGTNQFNYKRTAFSYFHIEVQKCIIS